MIADKIRCVAIVAALIFSARTASGEGIPVIDRTSILKHMESIAQLKSQLDALHHAYVTPGLPPPGAFKAVSPNG